MTAPSVSQLLSLIKHQIEEHTMIHEQLSKAEALTKVALSTNFSEFPAFVIHDYFWTLSDLVEECLGLNEKGLDFLIKASNTASEDNTTHNA